MNWLNRGVWNYLKQVLAECDGDCRLHSRFNNQNGNPQSEEGNKLAKSFENVGIGSTRFDDSSSKLRVANGAYQREETSKRPTDEREGGGAGSEKDSCWRQKNSRADDISNNKSNTISKIP